MFAWPIADRFVYNVILRRREVGQKVQVEISDSTDNQPSKLFCPTSRVCGGKRSCGGNCLQS